MANWIDHNALALMAAWYVFSAVVSGMPQPAETSGVGYRWAYHSLHILAGDLSRYWLKGESDPESKISQPGDGANNGVDIQH